MKNFHMELIRVTEAGAIAASKWVGRGDKIAADKSATDAMRNRLDLIDCCMEVAIGEGQKDGSYGLFEGELLGSHRSAEPNGKYSIAIDPIEGTTPVSKGGTEAISVIAMGELNSLYKSSSFYMDKFAVGPQVLHYLDQDLIGLNYSASHNVKIIAETLGKSPKLVTVCVIDRPRTQSLVEELKKIGCRIKFISDCDVTACIAACVPDSGIDMYWSIGGSPEAVIAACAMKCMGGYLQCREMQTEVIRDTVFEDQVSDRHVNPVMQSWIPTGNLLEIEDLAQGEVMFAATGITDGQLLKGVRYTSHGPKTNSVAMRSESGTVRWLTTEHGN